MDSSGLSLLDRTEAAFRLIDWEQGQRPSWWRGDCLVWRVEVPHQAPFASSCLDQIAQRLASALREPLSGARERLFLWAPLLANEEADLGTDGPTVSTHLRHAYLRREVARLAHLEVGLKTFREQVIGEVLALVAASAAQDDPAEADRLMAADDPHFYLGVALPTLKRWAKEFEAFEVTEFATGAAVRAASNRATRSARDTTASQEQSRLDTRWSDRIREFESYFDAPDFEPRNEREDRAWTLHRAMRAARSAAEEEQAMVERDRYLIDHVFKKD